MRERATLIQAYRNEGISRLTRMTGHYVEAQRVAYPRWWILPFLSSLVNGIGYYYQIVIFTKDSLTRKSHLIIIHFSSSSASSLFWPGTYEIRCPVFCRFSLLLIFLFNWSLLLFKLRFNTFKYSTKIILTKVIRLILLFTGRTVTQNVKLFLVTYLF